MDNTQAQVLHNFRSLFGRYKAVVTQNERTTRITVDNKTVEVNKIRTRQTQQQTIRL
jgi:hypothetical protein